MRYTYLLMLLFGLFGFGSFAIHTTSKDAASEFINSLSEAQYEKAVFDFNDNNREIWSFLPGAMMWRPGLRLDELSETQKGLLFYLLKSSLSETGYHKVERIMDLENVLAELEADPEMRNADNYFVSFNGDPNKDSLWAWSFEGHHLSLKFTISPGKIAVSPRFMGANPATIPIGKNKGERVLAKEEDFGLELINSMDADQKKIAIFQKQPYFDIVTQNASEVGPLHPVGISAKEMGKEQQKLLEKLIYEYLATLPEPLANERLEQIKREEFEKIRFGWAGSTNIEEGHYYRIQGETFLIEFDNFLSNANHIHSVWREFDGDFGRDLIREHYRNAEHHKHD